MRSFLTLISAIIIFLCGQAFATSPPFTSVTIHGKTDTKFNKVSLFKSGDSNTPFKTREIVYNSGEYSITVFIPSDMGEKDNYYFTDMRFWEDANGDGMKDNNEAMSECHFIIWVPSTNQVHMQVYKGSKHPIESPYFQYDYK